jgi:hypothetical protein
MAGVVNAEEAGGVAGGTDRATESCVASVITDQFVFGAIAMLTSFRQTNPWFKGHFVVLHNNTHAPLSQRNRMLLSRTVPDLVFREVDETPYAPIFDFAENVIKTPVRLRAAFFILEAFRLPYERVVALDSDMLVLGDLSYLFGIEDPFAAVRAQEADGRTLPYFNTGTMVITAAAGGAKAFDEMAASLAGASVNRDHGKADQAVLNLFFRDRDRHILDSRYNFSKRLIPSGRRDVDAFLAERDVRILHFLGEKPWNVKARAMERGYRAAEELWMRSFLRNATRETIIAFMRSFLHQEQALNRHTRGLLEKAGLDEKRIDRELSNLMTRQLYGA